jgi:hypothetical protein
MRLETLSIVHPRGPSFSGQRWPVEGDQGKVCFVGFIARSTGIRVETEPSARVETSVKYVSNSTGLQITSVGKDCLPEATRNGLH